MLQKPCDVSAPVAALIVRHGVTAAVSSLCSALIRCPVDPTVMIHETDNKRQFRFCIEAFKFIGLHDQVKNCRYLKAPISKSTNKYAQF